ncbi:MAG: CapA family protein, partial [Clostridiales bacterium]|nr:CapA family protein [Clostridiales bacterium]
MDAFYETLDTLREYDITPFGAGENLAEAAAPYIAEIGDVKIAFFASNQILPAVSWRAGDASPGQLVSKDPNNLGALADGILAAKETCDFVIVDMHCGIERDTLPNSVQNTTARILIDLGADIVIGAHPHVVQSFEMYNGKPIAYSLGNFIFNSRNPQTLLLLITIEHGGKITLEAVPCKMAGTLTYM